MTLLQQFRNHWSKKQFTSQSGKTLLAVSGGIDSMVMSHLFLHSGISFAVAHCNFGLRAEASELDEQLVVNWCRENNILVHTIRFNTKQSSQEWKKGTQETARILRYEWFEKIRMEHGYEKIATAHHANDNVETLLINLFRGTGITGIHGILPENGYIIRPLLFASKEMLAEYASVHGVLYRDDASNETDDYLRNAVRHNIVPAIKEWFPNAISSVNESINRFAEAEVLYRKAVEQERRKLIEQRGQDYYIPILKLKKQQPLPTLLYELLYPFNFTPAQLTDILHLLEAESGHYVSSQTHRVIRNREFLIVTTLPAETADLIIIENFPCTVNTGMGKFSFFIEDKPRTIPANRDIAYLDIEMIEMPLTLRKWRMGDYFYPFGMKMKKKKVSRLLIDEKIPLHEKEHVRILESGKRIAWVSGIRPDERFKVKESTERVLVVKHERM